MEDTKKEEEVPPSSSSSTKEESEKADEPKNKKPKSESEDCESAAVPTGPSSTSSKPRAEDDSKLREALEVCLKTLGLLLEMCRNKVKVQETAAAMVVSFGGSVLI